MFEAGPGGASAMRCVRRACTQPPANEFHLRGEEELVGRVQGRPCKKEKDKKKPVGRGGGGKVCMASSRLGPMPGVAVVRRDEPPRGE